MANNMLTKAMAGEAAYGVFLGETDITVAEMTQPDKAPLSSKEKKKDVPSRHFTFICSTELANKVQAIARKEGFTIRALMEYMMRQGIDSYESKHGKIKKIKAKGVSDVM